MPVDPNDEFVTDPVDDNTDAGGDTGGTDAPAQSIKVEETPEFKAQTAELERERQEKARLQEQLRQRDEPPPKKQEPTEDPLDALEKQIVEADAEYQAAYTWCRLNPKDENIAENRTYRDELQKRSLALKKQYRTTAAKAHVEAVKGVASKQSEYRQMVEHWQSEIANDPLCQELSEKAQALLLREIVANPQNATQARTYFREMVGLDPQKVSPNFRPNLKTFQGGRSGYVPTEGAGGGEGATDMSDKDFEKASRDYWSKRFPINY